jgi:hypothetical protein
MTKDPSNAVPLGDDLLDIGGNQRRFTPPFLGLSGSYGLSASRLPYVASTVSLRDLKEFFRLVEDLPTDITTNWRLQELYQREIDWGRVEHDIVSGYLNNEQKLKFFNAITVALLPMNEKGQISAAFPGQQEGGPWPEGIPKAFARSVIGPVEMFKHPTAPLMYLRWDSDRAMAAVIDGQHRVAALRKYLDLPLTSQQYDTQVPVIFLTLDARAGFEQDKLPPGLLQQENKLVRVVRELFIDLNKHAVEVSRARQILMNDRDIAAIGLRATVEERAVFYDPANRRIPLGVVDWQSDKAKIETGPFITTVVLLHICIEEMLDLKYPKDPTAPEELDEFVQSVENALGLDSVIASNPAFAKLGTLKECVEKEYKAQNRPLPGLPSRYLAAVEAAFVQKWSPFVRAVFLDFVPYKTVTQMADERQGLTGEWARVAALPDRAARLYFQTKGEDAKLALVIKPTEEIQAYKEDRWPFYGVFQKGLMMATAYLVRHLDLFAVAGKSDAETRNELAAEWVAFLNYLDTQGLLRRDAKVGKELVWGGIALTVETPPGGKQSSRVKWSGPAAKGIAALLLVWFFRRRDDRKKVGSFVRAIYRPENADKFPDFVGKKANGVSANSWLGRLSKGLDAEDTKQVYERIKVLADLVEPLNATSLEEEDSTSEAETSVQEEDVGNSRS